MKKTSLLTIAIVTFFSYSALSQVEVQEQSNMVINTDKDVALKLNRTNNNWQHIRYCVNDNIKMEIGLNPYDKFYFNKKSGGNVEFTGASNYNFSTNAPNDGFGFTVTTSSSTTHAFTLKSTYYNTNVFSVVSSGIAWSMTGYTTGSDKRYKTDIKDIDSSLETIKKLHGVKYKRKMFVNDTVPNNKNKNKYEHGLIAQDVEEILPDVVHEMEDGRKAIAYDEFIPILIEALKEQQVQIDAQAKEIDKLKGNNKKSGSINNYDISTEAVLYQNTPNPFSENTTIKIYLPENVNSADLYIYDMSGNPVKTINIQDRNECNVEITAAELNPGMYLYALIADGKEVDTKRMILTN